MIDPSGSKVCTRCEVLKPLDEFYSDQRDNDGKQSKCKSFFNGADRTRAQKDPRSCLVGAARARARRRGIPFDLTIDDIEVPPRCPALGMPLKINRKYARDNAYTLDRIIPEKGYVPGNVVIISQLANHIKTTANLTQLEAVAAWWRELEDGLG